ncbi:hypothetical protein C4T70_12525, partial [Clostridioides difficile]
MKHQNQRMNPAQKERSHLAERSNMRCPDSEQWERCWVRRAPKEEGSASRDVRGPTGEKQPLEPGRVERALGPRNLNVDGGQVAQAR